MNSLTQFAQQFGQAWTNSSISQRALLVGAVSLVVVGLWSVVFFTGQGDMAVLYADLSDTGAGSVVAALEERGIPYRLSQTGDTIQVPRAAVARTRLLLAQEGLPHGGGVGFELFDRSEFGITDFAQKVNFKRATEGELSRTINSMGEVKFARVQLVIPERRLFGQDQQDPTAAVFLFLQPGRALVRSQVRALQHLVSSSVEGLAANNVSITDQYANALAAPTDENSAAALSASQLEVRRAVERSLEQKVQSILDPVLGPGRSAVAVTAKLDFDRVERTIQTFDPDSQVARSEQRESEKTESKDPGVGGAAGVTANLPTATNFASAGGGGGSTKKSDSTITNYEIDSTVEHIVKAPSTIMELSVSVVVDGTYAVGAAGDPKTYQPRSDEEMANLKRLVAAAVGNTAVTKVEVLNVALDTSVQEANLLAETAADRRRLIEYGIVVGRWVFVLIVAFVAFGAIRRMVTSIAQTLSPRAAVESQPEAGGRLDLMAGPPTDTESRMTQLQQLTEDRPDDMATLIKSWLTER